MKNIAKLKKIASKQISNVVEDAIKREENYAWQKHSQRFAIAVLMTLKTQKTTQKQLAKMVGVSAQYISKLVKGKQKLNLETIAKIEKALNIELINIVMPKIAKAKPKVIQINFNRKLDGYDKIRLAK